MALIKVMTVYLNTHALWQLHRNTVKNVVAGRPLWTRGHFFFSSFIIATLPVSTANPGGCWKKSFYVTIATRVPNRILHYAQNTSSLIGAKGTLIQMLVSSYPRIYLNRVNIMHANRVSTTRASMKDIFMAHIPYSKPLLTSFNALFAAAGIIVAPCDNSDLKKPSLPL